LEPRGLGALASTGVLLLTFLFLIDCCDLSPGRQLVPVCMYCTVSLSALTKIAGSQPPPVLASSGLSVPSKGTVPVGLIVDRVALRLATYARIPTSNPRSHLAYRTVSSLRRS
jgi:hypothetical protein